jgi:hypothetical protein
MGSVLTNVEQVIGGTPSFPTAVVCPTPPGQEETVIVDLVFGTETTKLGLEFLSFEYYCKHSVWR